jgi:hypothetical protein
MNKLSKLFDYLVHDPKKLVVSVILRLSPIIPERLYLKWLFRLKMGYRLNLDNPQTFSEKLQWLKLYNRKPEYTLMTDKLAVKEYVASLIGEEYVIPTLGVWERAEDIEWDKLPDKFVLKTTHGANAAGVVVCRDKSTFNREDAIKKLDRSMKEDDLSTYMGEWIYKNIHRRIIAEELLEDTDNASGALPDYKFYCFSGIPKYCQVIRDRNTKETIDFYDMEWEHMPFVGLNPVTNGISAVTKPAHLDNMIQICRKLSTDMVFSRIDLYVVNDRTYFGEITLFPASGLGTFTPNEYNTVLGNMIKLPLSSSTTP